MITLNATHQQTKKVIDPVNGTYRTVLTINSSVDQSDIVGTYSCTVRNVKGESSEAVVVPGEACSIVPHILSIPVLQMVCMLSQVNRAQVGYF